MVSAEHNTKRDDDKNKKKKKRTKSAPTQYTYIAKIAKKYLGVDKRDSKGKVVEKNPNRLTFSKAGIAEVSILMDSAVKQILQNSDQVMIYTGGKTLGKQTVEVATKLALSGLLCDKAMKAGSKAVENYNCFDKDRPEASPNVAVEEGQQ
jgi:hypothetical protein